MAADVVTRRGRTRPRDVRCPVCDAPRGASCATSDDEPRTEAGHHVARVELATGRTGERAPAQRAASGGREERLAAH